MKIIWDNSIDSVIYYLQSHTNDATLDPNDYLTVDNVYSFKIVKQEDSQTESVIDYRYKKRPVKQFLSLNNYKTAFCDYVDEIVNVIYPSGLSTQYDYTLRCRNVDFYSNVYYVSSRCEIDGNAVYNEYSYAYDGGLTSSGDVTTVMTRELDGVTTTYEADNMSSPISKMTIKRGTLYYIEDYSYRSLAQGKRKRQYVSQKYKTGFTASPTRTVATLYDYRGRITSSSHDGYTETYTYHGDTAFLATKIYNIDANRYVKYEYILSSPVSADDPFTNRTVDTVNVYESTDGGATYTLRETTDYTYDSYGNVSSITLDPNGLAIESEYDYSYLDGETTIETTIGGLADADGLSISDVVTTSHTDRLGRTDSTTDGNGNVTLYSYDELGRPTLVTNPDLTTVSYEYNTASRYTIATDENGNTQKAVYDGFGNIIELYVEYDSQLYLAAEYGYDALCRLVTVKEYKDFAGSEYTTTTYEYRTDDKLFRKTVRDKNQTIIQREAYAYDYLAVLGNGNAHDIANGGTATSNNFLCVTKTIRTADGRIPPIVASYYDRQDRLVKTITTVTENGIEKTYISTCTYDNLGNVLETMDERTYDEFNVDYTSKNEYNYKGQVTKAYNAEGNYIENTYDAAGRLVSAADYEGNITEYSYDAAGRLLSTTVYFDANTPAVTKYYYDANGNVIQESAQKSASAFVDKYFKYDNRNRAYAVSDGERYTKYLFDNKGNITKSVYGLQNYNTNISTGYTPPNATYTSVVYAYDELDRLISKTDYLGTEYYEYDLAGNMTESTDAAGNVTAQSFDAKGNLLSSTVNSADAITYTYNFYSWLTSTTRGNDTISYSYDNLGRVASETCGGVVKNYSYDIAGNMKHFELVEDNTTTLEVDYTYDILNRMSSAVNVGGGLDSDATSAVENADVTVNYAYNGNSLITSQTVGQYVTSYSYNGANLLTNLTNSRNSTTLSAFDYTYYLSGNISGVTDTRQSQPTRTYAYTYNDRNMLTNATKTVGTDVTEWIYAYDADGDRTASTVTLNGNTQQSTAYTYTVHKLTGTTLTDTANAQTVATAYTYDTRGNLTGQTVTTTPNNGTPSVVTTTNTYNSRNELVGKTDGTNTYAYSYDANGLRNSKTVNGSTTNYIWSGQNIVSENTASTNTYYFYGLNRVSRKMMGTAYEGLNEDWDNNDNLLYSYAYDGLIDYYLYDGHGSVVQTYDPDRNSQVTVHYGATANSTNFVPELDYSGNSWIDLSDLNYYNQSYPIVDNYYYDPFGELEAAPAFDTNPYRYCGEYWDSESGEIYLRARYYSPRTGRFNRIDPVRDGVNWYVYCWNNPIMNIDPLGLESYIFYTSTKGNDFSSQAQWQKERLEDMGETVVMIEVSNVKDFMDGWNGMGIANGETVDINYVMIYTHGNERAIMFENGSSTNAMTINGKNRGGMYTTGNINDLQAKEIKEVDLLSCNGGNILTYYNEGENVASVFSKKVINGKLIAYDGNVSFGRSILTPWEEDIGKSSRLATNQSGFEEIARKWEAEGRKPMGKVTYHDGQYMPHGYVANTALIGK